MCVEGSRFFSQSKRAPELSQSIPGQIDDSNFDHVIPLSSNSTILPEASDNGDSYGYNTELPRDTSFVIERSLSKGGT